MKLTLRECMWAFDGSIIRRDNPVQYEVVGLPSGRRRIILNQNLNVRPIRWKIVGTDTDAERPDFESPEAALAALQAEFGY